MQRGLRPQQINPKPEIRKWKPLKICAGREDFER
jgi:hypothetical protein